MPTFQINEDEQGRARKIALRRLANRGGFDSLVVNDNGITIIADEAPRLPSFLVVKEVKEGSGMIEIGGQKMTKAQFDAARLPLLDSKVPDVITVADTVRPEG